MNTAIFLSDQLFQYEQMIFISCHFILIITFCLFNEVKILRRVFYYIKFEKSFEHYFIHNFTYAETSEMQRFHGIRSLDRWLLVLFNITFNTKFESHHNCQFNWWKKQESPKKTTDHPSTTKIDNPGWHI